MKVFIILRYTQFDDVITANADKFFKLFLTLEQAEEYVRKNKLPSTYRIYEAFAE